MPSNTQQNKQALALQQQWAMQQQQQAQKQKKLLMYGLGGLGLTGLVVGVIMLTSKKKEDEIDAALNNPKKSTSAQTTNDDEEDYGGGENPKPKSKPKPKPKQEEEAGENPKPTKKIKWVQNNKFLEIDEPIRTHIWVSKKLHGSKSNEVQLMQVFLNLWRGEKLAEDGYIGNGTMAAFARAGVSKNELSEYSFTFRKLLNKMSLSTGEIIWLSGYGFVPTGSNKPSGSPTGKGHVYGLLGFELPFGE